MSKIVLNKVWGPEQV